MKLKIVFLLLIMFLLNGFSNARELNDLAIVSAIGIDMDENGDYIITSQILNTKKENSSGSGSGSSSGSSEIVVLNSSSSSIQTALRNIVEESPRKLYLAHMELLLISEKVADEKNILDTLNFFIRDNEGSNDFMLVITKDTTPQEVLKILTPLESNPAQNIMDSILATNRYKGNSTNNILNDNIVMFLRDNQAAVLASIEIDDGNKNDKNSTEQEKDKNENSGKEQESGLSDENKSGSGSGENSKDEGSQNNKSGSEEESKIKVSNLGFFKDRTLSGYLKNEECYIYNLLLNEAKGGIIQIGEEDDLLVLDQISLKTQIIPKVENDSYFVDINVNLICNVTETGKNVSFDSNEEYLQNKKRSEEYLKAKIEDFMKASKEDYKCDLIGVGNIFYKYKNSDYKILKAKYGDEYLSHIDYNIKVNIEFPNEGSVHDVW